MIINCENIKKLKKYNDILFAVANSFESVTKISKEMEVNITFASRFNIKKINKQTRNINKVTDVLSFPTLVNGNEVRDISKDINSNKFPLDINPQTNALVLGDIVFCLSRIKHQAKKYGNTLNRELGYMFVHGLLHLIGYDHMNDKDKSNMRIKEEEILSNINLVR